MNERLRGGEWWTGDVIKDQRAARQPWRLATAADGNPLIIIAETYCCKTVRLGPIYRIDLLAYR
jgi:hypothetical protein